MKKYALALLVILLLAGCAKAETVTETTIAETFTQMPVAIATEAQIVYEIATEAMVEDEAKEIVLMDEIIEPFDSYVMKEGEWYPVSMIRHYSKYGYMAEYNPEIFVLEEDENRAKFYSKDFDDIFVTVDIYPKAEKEKVEKELKLSDSNINSKFYSEDGILYEVRFLQGESKVFVITAAMPDVPELIEGIGEDLCMIVDSFKIR